ncbi:MAG: sugar nucleotide-binding protein, partial [Candidatus Omnitrophota bacterium]
MPANKILITGASGMLGQALTERLSSSYEVTGTSQSGKHQTFAVDLTQDDSAQKAIKTTRPDLVIHCAAASNVDGCEKDPGMAYRVNAL